MIRCPPGDPEATVICRRVKYQKNGVVDLPEEKPTRCGLLKNITNAIARSGATWLSRSCARHMSTCATSPGRCRHLPVTGLFQHARWVRYTTATTKDIDTYHLIISLRNKATISAMTPTGNRPGQGLPGTNKLPNKSGRPRQLLRCRQHLRYAHMAVGNRPETKSLPDR